MIGCLRYYTFWIAFLEKLALSLLTSNYNFTYRSITVYGGYWPFTPVIVKSESVLPFNQKIELKLLVLITA
jgi:hypothetical protein